MDARIRTYLPILALTLPLAACARCAPGTVGQGVSRLTIRNVGAISELLNKDTRCGFESEAVKASVQVSGKPGGDGVATWTATDCVIDLPLEQPLLSEDCNQVQYQISGRVNVTAVRTIAGTLTGDPASPIIPGGPDAVTIDLQYVDFQNFRVQTTASPNVLEMISGSISAKVAPRLAVAADVGACSVATKNAVFTDVVYGESLVHVTTDSRDFDVDVMSSNLSAVHGKKGDLENWIWGSINVWGSEEEIPTSGDEDGLDPEYDPEVHLASYACTPGLAQPVRYDCEDFLGPTLAQSSARLTIRAVGRIAKAIEMDTRCGFSSPSVAQAAIISGEIGRQGSATLLAQSCTLNFPEPTVIKTTCTGIDTVVQGSLTISATKRVEGRLTGDLRAPVVPMTDHPAEIVIAVESFNNFEITENGTGILYKSGAMSGKLVPRVAADAQLSGACSFTSDIARFNDISYDAPTDVMLISASGSFGATLDGANLQAVNGTWGSDSNTLDGSITLNGETFGLPTDPRDDGLDPSFEQSAFDASWQCGSLEMPVRHECDFTAPLAQGAAQLTIQMVGSLAKLLDANAACGFSSSGVALNPTLSGELGRDGGAAVYRVTSPCQITFPSKTEIARDCNGKRTYAQGTVYLTGTKVVSGIVSGHPVDAIVPTSRDPAEISVSARFEDFALWSDPETKILTAKSGRLSGVLRPRLGIDTESGACSISTPIAQIQDVAYQDAVVSINNGGKRFDLTVGQSLLQAQNGNGDAATNRLTGSMVVDGTAFNVPVAGQPLLDPEYNQATFDQSYACIPNFRVAANDQQCNMRQVLAEGVARLLVMTAGTIASEVNANDDCGFENFWVKTSPSNVVGDAGSMGSMEWDVSECEMRGSASPVSADCLGRGRFMLGDWVVDAHRTVNGLREKVFLIVDSIVPVTHNAVEIALQEVLLDQFEIYELDPSMTDPGRALRIETGRLAGTVRPITGRRADDPDVYDVPTPVAQFEGLNLSNAEVYVMSEGKTFKVFVDATNLNAFNGSFNGLGLTNYLGGSVTIEGQQFQVGGKLNPDFEQRDFDDRYTCDLDLGAPIPPAP